VAPESAHPNATSPTRHRRRRQHSRTTLANTESQHEHIKCINSEERLKLVQDQAKDQTGYIYHLWNAIDSNKKHLIRTFTSPDVARHDVLCWLINRQNSRGASREDYWRGLAYEEDHERC